MGVYSDGCWIDEVESISYLYVFPQLILVVVRKPDILKCFKKSFANVCLIDNFIEKANFIMFVNIIRELVVKLRDNIQNDSNFIKYK